MEKKIFSYIGKYRLIECGDNVVVGVSGGADSVCLLHILSEYRKVCSYNLYAVHVNHGIRGEEAERDENYSVKLCEELNVPIKVYRFDVVKEAKAARCTVEEQGRTVRYKAFNEVLASYGGGKIAVAHHMNDQAETVLFNLIRGSGIKGMTGMAPVKNNIIRPLLGVKRQDIEEYLSEKNITYCTDSTNLSDEYIRNKFRLNIIPYLSENINASVIDNISNMSQLLGEADDYISAEADKLYSSVLILGEHGKNTVLDAQQLKEAHPVLRKYVLRKAITEAGRGLKDITRNHLDSLDALLFKETGREINLPGGFSARMEYNTISIYLKSKNEESRVEPFTLVPGETYYEPVTDITITSEIVPWDDTKKISTNDYTKMFDYDKIKDTLQIRTRETGDYIFIDSQGRKKSLKAYFIDEKIPRELRDRTLVLAEDNSVLWVLGHRIGEKYKISKDTKQVLCVQMIYGGNL